MFFVNSQGNCTTCLNERYDLEKGYTVFGGVVATDSLYYVIGGTDYNIYNWDGAMIRYNLDGSIKNTVYFDSDTIGYDFWGSVDFISTLDGNFVTLSSTIIQGDPFYLTFFKFNPQGDSLFTKKINNIPNLGQYRVVRTPIIFQLPEDSSFTCVTSIANSNLATGNILIINLSKIGTVNWYKTYLAPNSNTYRLFIPEGLVRKPDNGYYLSGYLYDTHGPPLDERQHIRILDLDSLGNVLNTFTDWNNPFNYSGSGLTFTKDSCLIFSRFNGVSDPDINTWRLSGQIVKMNSNNQYEWIIILDTNYQSAQDELNKIISINEDEFVIVGSKHDTIGLAGNLIKFNLDGEVIWNRSYIKVPLVENKTPTQHKLYDVDQTADGGFVMVGQAINYNHPSHQIGQMGWLIKTDKHGCLIPDCHLLDDVLTVKNDLFFAKQSNKDIKVLTYPNPVQNEFYIYYGAKSFSGHSLMKFYAPNGQLINSWPISTNYTTYSLNVENLSSGVYILKTSTNNQVIQTNKIVIN